MICSVTSYKEQLPGQCGTHPTHSPRPWCCPSTPQIPIPFHSPWPAQTPEVLPLPMAVCRQPPRELVFICMAAPAKQKALHGAWHPQQHPWEPLREHSAAGWGYVAGLVAQGTHRMGTHVSMGTHSGCHTWGCEPSSLWFAGWGSAGSSLLQGEKQRHC